MSDYPEHDKLHGVKDDSTAIGAFLDFGLPKQHLILYERRFEPCECRYCERGRSLAEDEQFLRHMDTAKFKDGTFYYERWRPTQRTIQSILATYFDIDEDKLAAEKQAMYETLSERTNAQ